MVNLDNIRLVFIAFAPVLIIAFYVYFRDKYEKEPVGILFKSLLIGALITIPVVLLEEFFKLFEDYFSGLFKISYTAFILAALVEELCKYLAFYLLIWWNRNFNEKFDGITYAVFISLGFASVENVLYVFEYGYSVGLLRAFTAVPAHALFGIVMGYHFGLAKFFPDERNSQLLKALLVPILLHGIYNFCLMANMGIFMVLFIPFIIYLWITGFRRMKDLSSRSIFRDDIH
ncbi:MAG: PrsW family intramembrane metalloprotease [Bacteroidales bacterium]|nr:PrsW family intramembrane metalloprotease [Bacteroidales bacterium]